MNKEDVFAALYRLENDALASRDGYGDSRKDAETIRAALTAQLTKTDDNVSCPSVANAGDINAELLEALKMAESFIRKMSGGGETDFRKKLNKAIARAEAQKVGE